MPFRTIAALVALLISGAADAVQAQPLRVLATVGMVGDLAAAVGGDCAVVEVLVPAGADPHVYRPTAADVRRLGEAELILHVGFGLEGQFGALLGRISDRRPVLAVGPAGVPAEALIPTDEMQGVDPHLWMDPALWSGILAPVAAAMAAQRPDCAADFTARAAEAGQDLAALDGWLRESIASIPEPLRVLVTAHDAFGYFARAYGLREEAIQGLSTESEAGIADIRAVADIVLETGVPVVFVESSVNPRAIRAMIESVSARGGHVAVGGELFSDSLGPDGTAEGTYVGMLRHNGRTVTLGLGGTPAPWPERLAPFAARWGLAE
ncbi:MAG: metal ABC transporter solute-binding protein, Zn/Mn family [Gemmobacter sp.]